MANEVEIRVTADSRVGRGFAQVRKQTRAMIRSLAKDFHRDGDDAGGRMARGVLGGLGKALTVGLKPLAAATAGAFAVQFIGSVAAALASGVAKLVKGFGAGLALLPAVALAGAAALGALKIAVSGVGDALSAGLTGDTEAFNEALEGLSPSAREVAREVVGLKDQLDGLKASVQESFFAPLVGQIRPLAERYLPQTQGLLSEIAQSFGRAANQASGFLQMPGVVQKLTEAFGDVSIAVTSVVGPLGLLPQILVPLITVGASFLPQLTEGFGGAAANLAIFMQEAERTGALADFIQRGIDSIRSLIDTGAQVGRIFGNIGSIGETVWGAMGLQTGDLLGKVESLTGQFDKFLSSAKGSEALRAVFGTLGSVLGSFRETVGRVAGILGDVFGPIMPQIGEFVEAFFRLRTAVTGVGLDALEPILHGIGDVLGSVVLPVLTGLANWLADNKPVLQGALISLGTLIMANLVPAFIAWAAAAIPAAAATLAAAAPVIALGIAIAALAALVIIHFDTIKAAISAAFNWVVENWPLLLAILTGPIGIAVLLIVNHWDTITGAASAAFNWLQENWPLVLAIITGPIGLAVLAVVKHWDKIKDGFRAAKDFIGDRVSDIVGLITGIPGRIGDIGRGIANAMTSGFKAVWNATLGGLVLFPGFDPPGPGPSIPRVAIPELAHGGIRSGLAIVGERGKELVDLGAGGRVHSGPDTERMMAAGGGGSLTINVYVEGSIRSDREIVEIIADELNRGGFRGVIRDR